MSRPRSSLVFLALCACALLGQCLAATTDQQCLDACSDYSISIGHCRDVYGNEREWPATARATTTMTATFWIRISLVHFSPTFANYDFPCHWYGCIPLAPRC